MIVNIPFHFTDLLSRIEQKISHFQCSIIDEIIAELITQLPSIFLYLLRIFFTMIIHFNRTFIDKAQENVVTNGAITYNCSLSRSLH